MPRNEDSKYRQGKYRPHNPQKYGGNPSNIVYRSSYELKFMQYCDLTESVNSWKSEEFCVAYRSPIDDKVHRYFPDFFVKYKDKDGTIRSFKQRYRTQNIKTIQHRYPQQVAGGKED